MDTIKKHEWPHCAEQAVKHILAQCKKFSVSGVPSAAQLASLIEVIDEFIFSWSSPASGGRSGGKRRTGRLTSIQQLQLVQMLAEFFGGDQDFNLLCSAFMILFMVQGRDVEYKVNILARLLSYALSVNGVVLLNFGGVWLTQQSPTSVHSLAIARVLVSDWVSTPSHTHLHSLPSQSPLFTTNLLASLGELYSGVTSGGQTGDLATSYSPPPPQVASLVTAWLRSGHETSASGEGSLSVPVPGTSPAASLLPWSVFSPLDSEVMEDETASVHSLLHLTLVDIVMTSSSSQLPAKYLTHLTEGLLARLTASPGSHSPDQVEAALDRYGQLMAAAMAGNKLKLDKDHVALMKKLPENRLVNIVLKKSSL